MLIPNGKSAEIWNKVAIFLGGVVLSGAISIASYPRNVVTMDQLPTLISENSKYTQDSQMLRQQLDSQSLQISLLQSQVSELQIDVARIGEHLGVPRKK